MSFREVLSCRVDKESRQDPYHRANVQPLMTGAKHAIGALGLQPVEILRPVGAGPQNDSVSMAG